MRGYLKLAVLLFCWLLLCNARWSEKKAKNWYAKYTWSAGFNYAPSYAVNEIEMWESFDETVVDRELKWAHDIGFSKLRVFLHVGPYQAHAQQFFEKIDKFVLIAKKYDHHMIPLLFDDCWKPQYQMGSQPDPIPGVHNSQWVQCPGETQIDEIVLRNYVTDVISHFKNEDTVVMWDLYN